MFRWNRSSPWCRIFLGDSGTEATGHATASNLLPLVWPGLSDGASQSPCYDLGWQPSRSPDFSCQVPWYQPPTLSPPLPCSEVAGMAQLGSSSWASPQNDGILGRYRYEMLFFWSPSRRNPIKSPHIRMASDGLFENAVPQNQVVVFSIKTAMLHNFESTPDFTVTERNEDITRRTILGRHLSELLRAMFLPRIRRTLHHRQCESTVWMQLPSGKLT